MRKLFLSFAIVGLLFSLATPASAIDVYARIRGVVTDPSGAVIAGAKVSATSTATGIVTTATTASDGSYELLQLPAPSSYDLKCEKTGFKAYVAEHLRVVVGQIYVQNIQMTLGQVTQQVTVEAAPTQVEKTSIQLTATVSGSQIVDMPLNGRNWVQLQQTLPGVVAQADGRGNYSTNGSQTDQNSFLVNGVDTNDLPLNTPLILPSPDAIAEFHMVTNTINPEYGRNSGAILNAITKSGSNSFHGSAFDFFRDTGLNSRNFYTGKIVYHQHQFGGTVGGPIWKDHTFFFFSYQGTRNRVPQAGGDVTVFSQQQRNGHFAGFSDSPSPFPLTGEDGTVYPAGTPYSTIFPTASIPTSDFSPLSSGLVTQFVPLPTSGSDFIFNPSTTGKADQYITRIDHTIGSRDSLWGSWFWQNNPTVDTLPFTGATLPGFGETAQRHLNQFVLTWNHTFSPNALNELRVGYTRFNFVAVQPLHILDPSSVGFTGITSQHPEASSYPRIDVTGYFSLGFSSNGPQPRIDQTRQFDENFTLIHGKHTFKLGFNARTFQVYNPFFGNINGTFGFGGSGEFSTGDPAADFMLGIPDTYGQGSGDIINARSQEYYSYFQDQYRIRPNLTLTFGTGWQVDTPMVDNYHANHAMIAWRPGQTSTLFPNSPTNYVFQGDPGVNAAGTTKYGHFGPRLGFAWSPGTSGKWSVRGGYGIYFNRSLEEQVLQFLASPPFGVNSGGVADAATGANPLSPSFANPWVDIAGRGSIPNKFPAAANPPSNIDFSGFMPIYGQFIDPNTSVPYAQNFNVTVERQLPGTAVLSVAYVGALGRKNVILREANPGINPAGCLADPVCVANRVVQNLVAPQNYAYDGTVFGGIGIDQTTGISNYNSMQVTLNKHMSHGLSFLAAYTWSHAMDDGSGFENSGFGGGGFGAYGSIRATNPFNQSNANYGPSAYDARHRFVISYTYDIPAIHHFDNWAAKRFFEGWRMNGITTLQTGFPLDVVDTNYRSLTWDAYSWTATWDVPNVVSAPKYLDPHNSKLVNATRGGTTTNTHYWFDPNTFSRAPLGTQGDAGRNPLRGPRIANFDWGFFKDTAITEQTRLELRFEFFNLFNHTQFNPSGISTNLNSSNFGRILSARDPRLIQLAAKFYF
jgi:Carboxypeptidase regulatory-like domain